MTSMQTDQAHPIPLARRNWWPVVYVVGFGGMAAYELARFNPFGLVWLGVLTIALAGEWLHARMGSNLDKATSAELAAALESQPAERLLVDRETDDILRIRPRRMLGRRMWWVERYPEWRQIADDVKEDFAAGRLSTIPSTSHLIGKRRISVLDQVTPVCVGDGGSPELYTPPGPRRHLRDFWLRIRTGAIRVDRQTVVDLAAQLRRAEPIDVEPEDEHAAA